MGTGPDSAALDTEVRVRGTQTPHNATICCVLLLPAFLSYDRRTAPWIPVNIHVVTSLTIAQDQIIE